MSTLQPYDTYVETEEFITAEEYLRRHKEGKIDPQKTRIAPPDMQTGSFGGFIIKLDVPRYKAVWPTRRHEHAW